MSIYTPLEGKRWQVVTMQGGKMTTTIKRAETPEEIAQWEDSWNPSPMTNEEMARFDKLAADLNQQTVDRSKELKTKLSQIEAKEAKMSPWKKLVNRLNPFYFDEKPAIKRVLEASQLSQEAYADTQK